MHLEELLATLIATIKTNTSSVDENNRLLRAQGATAPDTAPAPVKTTRAKKEQPAAPEPEPTPEPEPETPAAAVEPEPAPTPEAEKDDTDWVAKSKEETQAYRQANPEKRAAQVAALNVLFNEFGVDKISAVPAERGEEFYKLTPTFV